MLFGSNKNETKTSPAPKKGASEEGKHNENALNRSAKITERMDNVIEKFSGLDKPRSSELVPLTAEYDKMKHELRALVTVVKKYQQNTNAMNATKFELAQQLSKMSDRSPIHDEVGQDVDNDTKKDLEKLRQTDVKPPTTTEQVTMLKGKYRARQGNDPLSVYGLYKFGAAQAVANDNEYQSLVVDYAVDWERLVTERIDAMLKKLKKSEGDLQHYQSKVEKLRGHTNHKEEKGKEPSKGETEKLERNEEKLKDAYSSYEREAGKVCALIEAVTHDGYKDLYPLVKNYLKWEMNRVNREHDIAERLNEALESLNEKCGSKSRRFASPKEEPSQRAEDSSQTTEETGDKDSTNEKTNE